MEAKFSPRVKDVITFSREEALRLGHDYIGTEHLLLGLIREGEGMAIKILKSLGINLTELRKSVENSVKGSSTSANNLSNIPLTKQAEEHTSELQSHSDLVCRLLLEKKKKKKT